MNTETTGTTKIHGWLFYDAECALCVGSAARASGLLARRGFRLLPSQTPGTAERVGVSAEDLLARMHLLTAEGRRFAGADAFVEIAKRVPWALPLVAATRLPGVLPLLRRCYDRIAANRYCFGGSCGVPRRSGILDWLPFVLLPTLVFAFRPHLAAWTFMWAMAFALFAGCKWLTYRKAIADGTNFTARRALGYLFGWVGMEPSAFAKANVLVSEPRKIQWLAASGRVLLGTVLVWGGVRLAHALAPLAAGWVGMFGIILILHFGLFHWVALAWQSASVPVKPLMRAPLLATSLGDFWGARWNTGFHTLAYELVFRPLRPLIGGTFAVLAVFLVSGLVHELVITVPARGGYGLPTAYFLLQGLGLVFERSSFGRKFGLRDGIRGRAFALLTVAAPVCWLFPPVFVYNVILPMLHALGAT